MAIFTYDLRYLEKPHMAWTVLNRAEIFAIQPVGYLARYTVSFAGYPTGQIAGYSVGYSAGYLARYQEQETNRITI